MEKTSSGYQVQEINVYDFVKYVFQVDLKSVPDQRDENK